MVHPQFTDYEMRTRHSFQMMMRALSYPGCIFNVLDSRKGIYADLAESLLDLETSFYCEDTVLLPTLQSTGARQLPADRAAYHFYPTVNEMQIETITTANIGTLTYPDQGATLFIGCRLGQGIRLKLTGPGIPPSANRIIQVDGIPDNFWQSRKEIARYPRGWDIFLIDGNSIVGLPRSTRIMIEE